MNLLFLNTYPAWGGGETWMLDVADGLRARGHRCLIGGRPHLPWFEHTRELGWDPLPLEIHGELAPLLWRHLHGLYRRAAIDAVICNFYKEVRLAAAARLPGHRPIIVNMKGLPTISDRRRHRLGYRFCIDHTVVCARWIWEEYLRRPWADPRRISVIYNCYRPGTDAHSPASADLRAAYRIPADDLLVGAVARFEPHKGMLDLVAAAPRVLAAHPRTTFLLIGDGRESRRLREQAHRAGVGRHIIFTGFRFDLDAIFPSLDLFALPSHHEGFPYVTQIAMYHGVPVVATRVGAVPEAIIDGTSGLLVDPGSPAQLAAAIRTLAADPALRRRLGGEARRIQASRFSYPRMIDRFESLLQELTRRHA